MKVLIDAVLFQLVPTGTSAHSLCAGVLRELVKLSDARRIDLIILDRGGLPYLGSMQTIGFPTYKASNSVADSMMLQRMSESFKVDVLVSTALTMPLNLATVQLICSEDEHVLMAGRKTPSEEKECDIAVACSSAQVFASTAAEHVFLSRFPQHHRSLKRRLSEGALDGLLETRRTADMVIESVEGASLPFSDPVSAGRYLALRRIQAGFESSDG